MEANLHRRRFLFGLGGLAALAARLDALGRVRPTPGPVRTLVLIQLTGGNDGLSTLVPYGDDGYAGARKDTRLGADEVLRLDARVGLHPSLGGLRKLYEGGSLALFEGVGYPQPNRSHFRSLDIWHAADARGRDLGSGWIGRCIERLESVTPHTVVHFGPRAPFSLASVRQAPLCLTPALLQVTDPARSAGPRRSLESGGAAAAPGETLGLLRTLLSEAESSAALLHSALDRKKSRVDYPSGRFARELRHAAALIHAELDVRVCSIELDGFDTHKDQRGRLRRLLEEMDAGLAAFARDLEQSEAGREALVVLFSEFGRRVAENASGGTDHGAAGLALALGPRVQGGLHGRPPALDALEDGDLSLTTDYRSLYARCIEHVFELDPEPLLGGRFESPAFVRSG